MFFFLNKKKIVKQKRVIESLVLIPQKKRIVTINIILLGVGGYKLFN